MICMFTSNSGSICVCFKKYYINGPQEAIVAVLCNRYMGYVLVEQVHEEEWKGEFCANKMSHVWRCLEQEVLLWKKKGQPQPSTDFKHVFFL